MDTDAAAEILRSRYGVTGPVTVHETWGTSLVVEIDGLFIKANGDRSTAAESQVARQVRAAGVPAPEVVDHGTDERLPGGTWIVMPRMPGVGFDASNATRAQISTAVADVAGYLAILRDLSLPGWGRIDDDGRGTAPSWADYLREQTTASAAWLGDRLPAGFLASADRGIATVVPHLERGSILHHDLGLAHVLVEPSTGTVTGILDWADAIIGDPLFDVATFSMGGPAGDPIQAVLQPALLAACDVDPDDRRIQLYRGIYHLSNAAWSVQNNVVTWTDDLCRAAVDLIGHPPLC